MDFRLLHLSDIHIGSHCRASGAGVAEALADELFEALFTHGLRPPFSALVLSGDFTSTASEAEFATAAEWIARARAMLEIPREHVLIIPGNHDIGWGDVRSGFRPRAAAEKEYRRFYSSVIGEEANDDLSMLLPAIPSRTGRRKLLLAGLNSCRFEGRETAGLGYVGRDQFDSLLAAIGEEQPSIKVAVLHHHLVPIFDPPLTELFRPREDRRFSLTIDSASLLSDLIAADFRLVLHGHMHTAQICVERRIGLMPEGRAGAIAVLSCGSYSVKGAYCAENHFQVIDIGESDIQVRSITLPPGVRHWTATRKSWAASGMRCEGEAYQPEPMPLRRERRAVHRHKESWLVAHWILVRRDDSVAGEFLRDVLAPAWRHLGKDPARLAPLWAAYLEAARLRDTPLAFFEAKLEGPDCLDYSDYVLALLDKAFELATD
jgi:DNA repair exonuclease SbcCD nuclease subunit